MKYYLGLIVIILLFYVNPDRKDVSANSTQFLQYNTDSLRKYSYPLLGIRKLKDTLKAFLIGTCSFVRKDSLTLIITAKHNLSGYNTFTFEPVHLSYDTIAVGYYDATTKNYISSNLNIISAIKKRMANDYFFNKADLIVMPFLDTILAPYINPINSFVFDTIIKPNEILDSALAYGFAYDSTKEYQRETKSTFYKGEIIPINTGYPVNDNMYYTTRPISKYGMSGSPIFFRYIRPDKTPHIVFGGVVFGKNEKYNVAYSIIPELINLRVKYFLNKQYLLPNK